MKIYENLSQVYDLGWGDFSRQYVSLIEGLLKERNIKNARILDLACGTGILAIELARNGHTVVGIDVSPDMINIARSKMNRSLKVSFKVADMSRFKVKGEFDLVTCTFDSINYLVNIYNLKEAVNRIAGVLRTSGLFVFDSNTKRLYRGYNRESRQHSLGGKTFIQRCSYDPKQKKAVVEFIFPDGSTELHRQRPYDLPELKPILSSAGLKVLDVYSWFDKRPYTSKTEKLFCIAEKV